MQEQKEKYKKKKTWENFEKMARNPEFDDKNFGLEIDEERIIDKVKLLMEIGSDFYFKMNRRDVAGSKRVTYQNFTENVEEPYKTVLDNMIRLKEKTKSANLRSSVLNCEDNNAEKHCEFLKLVPEPFKEQI